VLVSALAAAALAAGGAHVSVAPARVGHAVPRSYLGLSVEWDSVEAYARHAAALERLLAPLARSQGGMALRIGGDSGDQSWWNPSGRRRPRGVLHNVTPRTLDGVAALARAAGGGPVTLGVNLALRDSANALALARAARERFDVDTLELGNEPDLYTLSKTFRSNGRVHRRVRKRARYGPAAYGRDVARYLAALGGQRAHFAVAGFAKPNWWGFLPGLLDRWHRRPRVVAVHMYALPYCDRAPPAAARWLTTAEASRTLAKKIRPIAGLARKRGLTLRVDELNSAVCGGKRGVSDRPAAAVWLADLLFALVNRGVDQADVHTWIPAVYAPFTAGGRPRAAFAGMAAFARAAPAGSRLVATRVTGGVRAWATRDGHGVVRVLLVAPRRVRVSIRVPHRTGPGAVALRARSLRVLSYRPWPGRPRPRPCARGCASTRAASRSRAPAPGRGRSRPRSASAGA